MFEYDEIHVRNQHILELERQLKIAREALENITEFTFHAGNGLMYAEIADKALAEIDK